MLSEGAISHYRHPCGLIHSMVLSQGLRTPLGKPLIYGPGREMLVIAFLLTGWHRLVIINMRNHIFEFQKKKSDKCYILKWWMLYFYIIYLLSPIRSLSFTIKNHNSKAIYISANLKTNKGIRGGYLTQWPTNFNDETVSDWEIESTSATSPQPSISFHITDNTQQERDLDPY